MGIWGKMRYSGRMNRFAKLSILLLKENRQEQLLKASEDAVYREELFKKYHI